MIPAKGHLEAWSKHPEAVAGRFSGNFVQQNSLGPLAVHSGHFHDSEGMRAVAERSRARPSPCPRLCQRD
eukprot:5284788-Pyramimonas_sp.AAC.1